MNSNSPLNSAVRKILSSGTVTVTGPTQRVMKQKVPSGTTITNSGASTTNNNVIGQLANYHNRCYICDDVVTGGSTAQNRFADLVTAETGTSFPNKIGTVVGNKFIVIVSSDDLVCTRCTNLINYLDRLENDVERLRGSILNLLGKKYDVMDEPSSGGSHSAAGHQPPAKMQKLNSGVSINRNNVEITSADGTERARKGATMQLLETGNKQPQPASGVQQMKIATQVSPQQQQQQQQSTQTLQRKTTRIYKCPSCDFKTSDMRLFNTHYESCKQQNFQCKNCKKIFGNFGLMKQHMAKEHGMSMENSCSICHTNFNAEAPLRKHMETTHSTNVMITGTSTQPLLATAAETSPSAAQTAYSCNHCQFKATDKTIFDDHMRKHTGSVNPKPFKCRVCSQRFETREQATVHAKQHQPNYFKCGTCAQSFPKREQLVQHFEEHQKQEKLVLQQQQQQAQQQHLQHQQPTQHHQQQQLLTKTLKSTVDQRQEQQQQQLNPNNAALTTQKLLQETIDEALREPAISTDATDTHAGSANSSINFFPCHICSLTFLQESYYNSHMETHRTEKKTTGESLTTSSAATTTTVTGRSAANSSAAINAEEARKAALSAKNDGLNNNIVSGNKQGGVMHKISTTTAAVGNISDADIESIFEKMHSDKDESTSSTSTSAAVPTTTTKANAKTDSDNLVITTEACTSGINVSVSLPDESKLTGGGGGKKTVAQTANNKSSSPLSSSSAAVSIDMPVLDHSEESNNAKMNQNAEHRAREKESVSPDSTVKSRSQSDKSNAEPVSMPSLDDEVEAAAAAAAAAGKQEDSSRSTQKAGGNNKQRQELKDKKVANGATGGGSANAEEHKNENAQEASDEPVQSLESDADKNSNAIADSTNDSADEQQLQQEAHQVMQHVNDGGDEEHGDGEEQHVTMELDEAMQAQVEGGQIKFLLNENGQLLQLENHIITDADGNQILVQDPEQIQQLLQTVGVLQSGDGLDGETLQMMTDGNGQMVLVQGDNEAQLIDASLLNAEGQLVIQQGADGDLSQGAHVIGEDGTAIPVSVSYTADGQPIVQVQQQVLESSEGQQLILEKNSAVADGVPTTVAEGSGEGSFFALEDLMQHSAAADSSNAKEAN